MQAICKGAPVREEVGGKYKYGGVWGQLRKVMRRIHPKTGEVMQEHCNQDGSPWGPGLKLYANLKDPEKPEPRQGGFYKYVPEPKPVLAPVADGVVQAAVEARRQRFLDKVASRIVVANPSGLSPPTLALPLQEIGTYRKALAKGDEARQLRNRIRSPRVDLKWRSTGKNGGESRGKSNL